MFSVTITASVGAIIISGIVLVGLMLGNDRRGSSRWIRKAIAANLVALVIVAGTYFICSNIETGADPYENRLFCIVMALSSFADILYFVICAYITQLIGSIVPKNAVLKAAVKKTCSRIFILGCADAVIVTSYFLLNVFNHSLARSISLIYYAELALVAVAYFMLGKIVYDSRKDLKTHRLISFSIYIVCEVLALIILWFTDETVFFSLDAALLLFFYITMQSDWIEKKNEDVKETQSRLKKAEIDKERETLLLTELSSIYTSLHLIDIKNDNFRVLKKAPDKAEEVIEMLTRFAGVQKLIWAVMKRVTAPTYANEARRFTDFTTLSDRMRGMKRINFEAIDDEGQWFVFSFIRVGSDLNADLTEVIFTSENIDQDRREKERLKMSSFVDMLTGVYNRNAYIAHTESLRKNAVPEDICVVVTDINGLKAANDSLGHSAGDELIKGTAECLKKAVGNAGTVYRNGGDEFVTIIKSNKSSMDAILDKMEKIRSEWSGEYVDELIFSKGCVRSNDFSGLDFNDLVKEADKLMYEDKKAFYSKRSDMDRRNSAR